MSLRGTEVDRLLTDLPAALLPLRPVWLSLMEQALWGDLGSSRLGTMSRLRKRLLDTGEALAGLGHSRDWIPHPRERLKSVLGAAIKLRDSLGQLQRVAQALDQGEDREAFLETLADFQSRVEETIAPFENRCAEILDTLHQAGRSAEE